MQNEPGIFSYLYRLVFSYFAVMSITFLFVTMLSDPGYLPNDLKEPYLKTPDGSKRAPTPEIRYRNILNFIRNGLYDFGWGDDNHLLEQEESRLLSMVKDDTVDEIMP